MAQTELQIIYGPGTTTGETLGGTTDFLLVNDVVWIEDEGEFTLEGDVIVQATAEADLATADAQLRAAFSRPKQRLRITYGAETMDFDPATNTGMQAKATIERIGEDDSGRWRVYQFRVVTQLPAKVAADNGRVAARIQTTYSGARQRTVRFTGTYTALSGTAALAQYQAQIASTEQGTGATIGGFAGTQLTALSSTATWELVSEDHDADDEDTKVDFGRTYRELVADQTVSARDQADLVDDRLTITRRRTDSGSALELGGAHPLVVLEVSYSADYKGTDGLDSVYSTLVRPHVLEQVRLLTGVSGFAVVGDAPIFNPTSSRISCTLSLVARDGGSLIEADVVTSVSKAEPVTIAETWTEGPLDAYVLRAKGRETMTIVTSRRDVGSKGGPAPGPGGEWTLLGREETFAHRQLGLAVTGETLEIWRVTWTESYRKVTEPPGGDVTSAPREPTSQAGGVSSAGTNAGGIRIAVAGSGALVTGPKTAAAGGGRRSGDFTTFEESFGGGGGA